jgi:hypothetical protein
LFEGLDRVVHGPRHLVAQVEKLLDRVGGSFDLFRELEDLGVLPGSFGVRNTYRFSGLSIAQPVLGRRSNGQQRLQLSDFGVQVLLRPTAG